MWIMMSKRLYDKLVIKANAVDIKMPNTTVLVTET